MNNNVMIDSSLLIEFVKGQKKKLLVDLMFNATKECFINETIVSEFLYYYVAIYGGRSPLATKSANDIDTVFKRYTEYRLIEKFSFLSGGPSVLIIVPDLMAKYNLLPNDAIILATCKIHNIRQLASHDSDFIIPCKAEGITLLME